MESILCGLSAALLVAILIDISIRLYNKDEILQYKERKDICRLLDSRTDILIRYKNCETTAYHAHVGIHKDTNEYIMIDLD